MYFQLQSLEQEFSALVKLDHPNLVHFQVFKYTQDKSAIVVEVGNNQITSNHINDSVLMTFIIHVHFCQTKLADNQDVTVAFLVEHQTTCV